MLKNSIVNGWVRHHRYHPKSHKFEYNMTWTLLDLDQVGDVFKGSKTWSIEKFNVFSYRANDFHTNTKVSKSIKASNFTKCSIIQTIRDKTGKDFTGKVFMLSHLRSFGYNFNSVCFYFCYDQTGQKLEFLVSEITNTPWGERHSYIFECEHSSNNTYQFEFDKEFHVSPFISMDMKYRWTFKVDDEHLRIHMVVNNQEQKKYFDATFTADFVPLEVSNMTWLALTSALQPLKMSLSIYWQALKLWLKRIKLQSHPKYNNR